MNAYEFMFNQIIGGHPIAISLSANFYKGENLEHLYFKMQNSEFLKSITEGTIGYKNISKQLNRSIQMTLSLSTFPDIEKLFYLIGCFPAGIDIEDFEEIWNEYLDPKYCESEDSKSVSSDESYIMVDQEL